MSEAPQPPPPVDYATPSSPGVPPANKDEGNMGLLMFILCIITGFIGPLILWLIKKDQSRYIGEQGKEVLNWCITMVGAYVVCIILMFVVIGFFLMPIVLLIHLIFNIMGIIAANKGQFYRYPFALRLLK
jgi:uncharacterized Tic20 family protein